MRVQSKHCGYEFNILFVAKRAAVKKMIYACIQAKIKAAAGKSDLRFFCKGQRRSLARGHKIISSVI